LTNGSGGYWDGKVGVARGRLPASRCVDVWMGRLRASTVYTNYGYFARWVDWLAGGYFICFIKS